MSSSCSNTQEKKATLRPPQSQGRVFDDKPLWNHVKVLGISAGGGGNRRWSCNYCTKTATGSYSKVKAHLLRLPGHGISVCPSIGDDILQAIKREHEGAEIRRAQDSLNERKKVEYASLPPNSDLIQPKKRKGSLETTFNVAQRDIADKECARMFYASALAFNFARSPYFRKYSQTLANSNLHGYVPPTYNRLRTTLLAQEKAHMNRLLQPLRDTWPKKGVSIVSDGWSDRQRRPLINIMASSAGSAMFVKSIDASGDKKDADYVANVFLQVIKDVGASNIVQIVTDNGSNFKAAGLSIEGSNVQGLQTTATFDPISDEFIIDTPNDGAIKWWIGNAAVHGKFATVFARLMLPTHDTKRVSDMGVHAFIVPIRNLKTHQTLPGIEIHDCGHKVGLNGVDNGALRFCSVRIPRDNLLNRFGDVSKDGKYTSSLPTINKRFAATLGELVGGRVGLAYSSVGVLKIAATIAIRYSLVRQQFGPPKQPEVSILDYQSQQHKLMPMLASTYAFHFATLHLVEKYCEMKKSHDEQVVADVHALSAGLKAYVTSYTAKSLSICREACGGHGYAAVNRFGSLRNDHDIFQTFEGDNTVLLQQVAGDLLKQYKEKFQGGTLAVTWNYLRESMNTYLSQPNPVTARWEGVDHLRDPSFQLDAFRYRTSRLLQSVAVRLRKHTKTLGSFGAWNRCLNHLLTLAESHIESVILAKFIEAVQSCPEENTRAALKLACDLYALDRIWNDIGTYRIVDYVAPNKAKAIHKLTEYLSFQVKNVARELVDAFDLPDHVTRAPIGMQSEAYSQYTQYVGF